MSPYDPALIDAIYESLVAHSSWRARRIAGIGKAPLRRFDDISYDLIATELGLERQQVSAGMYVLKMEGRISFWGWEDTSLMSGWII